jgi:hypothetical protein
MGINPLPQNIINMKKISNGQAIVLVLITLFFGFVISNVMEKDVYFLDYTVYDSEGSFVESNDTIINAWSPSGAVDQVRGIYTPELKMEVRISTIKRNGINN